MPKLSVIVPVYNVERYLNRCVDSILKQDYEDFELILINDGSPDNCGSICEEYAKRDHRIRVIHQENKGLAETRNVGIKNAGGKYISFIDSDDYIVQGTYSHCMSIIDGYNADILCFQHIDIYDNRLVEKEDYTLSPEIKLFSTQEALDALLYPNYIDVITCNKIIKKELFTGIKYPTGMLYEDMFTTYKYIAKAQKIVSTNQKFYVYCHREGSIGTQKYSTRSLDLSKAVLETYTFVKNNYPGARNAEVGLLFWLVVVANMMIKGKAEDKDYLKNVQKFGRKNTFRILSNPYLGLVRKMELLLFSFSLTIYKPCYFKFLNSRN